MFFNLQFDKFNFFLLVVNTLVNSPESYVYCEFFYTFIMNLLYGYKDFQIW